MNSQAQQKQCWQIAKQPDMERPHGNRVELPSLGHGRISGC